MGWIAYILLVIGGLNWGLIGFFGYDAITAIFGGNMLAAGARVIYALVGLAALYYLFFKWGDKK